MLTHGHEKKETFALSTTYCRHARTPLWGEIYSWLVEGGEAWKEEKASDSRSMDRSIRDPIEDALVGLSIEKRNVGCSRSASSIDRRSMDRGPSLLWLLDI
jgi:hypothetical protein